MKLVLTPHLQYKAKDVSSTMTNVEIAKDIHFLTFDVKNVNYDNYGNTGCGVFKLGVQN